MMTFAPRPRGGGTASTMIIREATQDDAPAIADIYNHYVRTSIATFEETEISAAAIAARIEEISASYPYLVASDDKGICGYAYANKWQERSAYRHTVISTIYLKPDLCGRGLGTALYGALMERLKPYHAIVGGISLPNVPSVGLHEKLGFKKVAHFEQVGFKFGKWIDVGYWEKVG